MCGDSGGAGERGKKVSDREMAFPLEDQLTRLQGGKKEKEPGLEVLLKKRGNHICEQTLSENYCRLRFLKESKGRGRSGNQGGTF